MLFICWVGSEFIHIYIRYILFVYVLTVNIFKLIFKYLLNWMSKPFIPVNNPVTELDCEKPFNDLADR